MRTSLPLMAAAIISLSSGPVLAGPCGTTKAMPRDPTPQHVNAKSSNVDREAKNLAGGQQPGSPGTVGAMNNVGADQDLGRKGSPQNGVGASSKNLAGSTQPADPGTIGALDNAGANQMLGHGKRQHKGC